jgi:hypothetical protein
MPCQDLTALSASSSNVALSKMGKPFPLSKHGCVVSPSRTSISVLSRHKVS